MKKLIWMIGLFLFPLSAVAQNGAVTGFCVGGAVQASVSGNKSANYQQAIIPSCTVTVYLTGTVTLATIYKDNGGTVLTNPFQASKSGQWLFFAAAASQGFDIVLSGGFPPNTYATPQTLTGVYASQQVTAHPGGSNQQIQYNNNGFLGGSLATVDGAGNIISPAAIGGLKLVAAPVLFGSLAACAGGTEGTTQAVIDSTTNILGATMTGGGSYHVSAYCNGISWVVQATANPALTQAGGPYHVPIGIIRNEQYWLDVRSQGVTMSGSDDTAAWQSVIANTTGQTVSPGVLKAGGYLIQFPGGSSTITAGACGGAAALTFPGAGATNMRLIGGDGSYASSLQDSGTNPCSAPMLQLGLGNSSNIAGALNIEKFQLNGANNTYWPDGQLYYNSINLSTAQDIVLKQRATGSTTQHWCSVGIGNTLVGSWPFFAEMKFINVGVNGTNIDDCNTGIKLRMYGGNTDFVTSNVEDFVTAVDILGVNGTPTFSWHGGHFERIGASNAGTRYYGGFVFKLDQVEADIDTEASSGMVWLGTGVVNSKIHIAGGGTGWYTPISDEGTGNRINIASASGAHGQTINQNGDEWFRTANNVVTDPTFLGSTAGWVATNATLLASPVKAPGAPAGRSLYVTPTVPGGFVSQTFTVTPGVDYLVAALFSFTYAAPQAEIQVFDNTTALLWDSGAISGPGGQPSNVNGSSTAAWNFIKQWIPSGASTSFTVRIIAPSTTPAQLSGLFILPSITTMGAVVANGATSCTGSGISLACAISGRGNGAQANNITLTISAPTYPSACFVRFHATTGASSLQAEVTLGATGTSNSAGQPIYFPPGISMDFNIPVGRCPTTIYAADFAGPTGDPNNLVISEITVIPIYSYQVRPITTPNDGLYVTGITPDGVQQRAASVPTTLQYQNPSAYTLLGSGSVQTVQTTTNIGPFTAGNGIEWQVAGIRTAGTGIQNLTLKVTGGANLLNCTYTNGVTSGGFVFKGWLTNVAGAVNSQVNVIDSVAIGAAANTSCGAADSIASFATWSSPITLQLLWQATSLSVNSGGTGCTTATGLATTTSGAGSGMIVNITAAAGALTVGTATTMGTGYAVGDTVSPTQGGCTGNFIVTNADHVTINKFVVYAKQ